VPIPTFRILAAVIPLQCAAMLGFSWYATRPAAPQPAPQQADRLVVEKGAHTLTLYARGKPIHTYSVAIGPGSGPKQRQGDHRTPEGHYLVDSHNPHSAFHLSLHISYPNADDRARALPAHQAPGGDIMIHGLPPRFAYLGALHRATDWTDGCIAVTDKEIEEIYRLVPDRTPIDIQP